MTCVSLVRSVQYDGNDTNLVRLKNLIIDIKYLSVPVGSS